MTQPTCAYCGWVGKTHPAVEQHITHRSTCSAAQRNKQNAPGPLRPRPPQQVTEQPRAQRNDSNTAGPSRSRSPSVTLEEVDDEDMPGKKKNPPQRNPNAILEDDDTYEPPPRNPPQRNPNAILEEVEHAIPPWGPHPFARQT
ncbi:hypothetical protein FRC07_013974 [Ceratobasidium sp. 392]|nr:hypothetical protein FRC07_013974 [Ceratobasidium sp. 392]